MIKPIGYTYYFTFNFNIETHLCFAYCEGRGWLWRMFFGWRKSDRQGCTFLLPTKAIKEIENLADMVRENDVR